MIFPAPLPHPHKRGGWGEGWGQVGAGLGGYPTSSTSFHQPRVAISLGFPSLGPQGSTLPPFHGWLSSEKSLPTL